jgi:hypothetical protein
MAIRTSRSGTPCLPPAREEVGALHLGLFKVLTKKRRAVLVVGHPENGAGRLRPGLAFRLHAHRGEQRP